MNILFVCCYINNSLYIPITKQLLEKNLINCNFDYICLNDAPNSEKYNYNKVVSIYTGLNAFQEIQDECEKANFIHIEIPQHIHEHNRTNSSQGGPRHIDNFNWFHQNIEKLVPNFKYTYDFLCYIDADAFLVKPLDLNELKNYDIAAPMIYIKKGLKYPHTGLFFINLKTIENFYQMNWDNTMKTDTGSHLAHYLKDKNFKIKELGIYHGYNTQLYWTENNHTIKQLKMTYLNNFKNKQLENYDLHKQKFIDTWYDNHFIHLRNSSTFLLGSTGLRDMYTQTTKIAYEIYIYKINSLIEEFNLDIDLIQPLFQ